MRRFLLLMGLWSAVACREEERQHTPARGASANIEVPEEPPHPWTERDQRALDFLLDDTSEVHVGTACYYAGSPAAGRAEVLHLVEGRRVRALRRILRQGGGSARGYAYFALIYLDQLEPGDELWMKRLRSSADRVVTCHGCLVRKWSFDEFMMQHAINPEGFALELIQDGMGG